MWRTTIGLTAAIAVASFQAARGESLPVPKDPTPRELWERLQREMPPFAYTIDKDETVTSDTDPRQKLRRIEVSFRSQTVGVFRRRMDHRAVVYMPASPDILKAAERRGKVVVIGQRYGQEHIVRSYGEPIAARTGYPTMVLPVPGEYGEHDGESAWIYFLESELRKTKDPVDHNYFRLAVPYIRALDVFAGILGESKIRGIIGGHSKRATSAFTAAAMDPERVVGVVYMGNESTWSNDDTSDPSRLVRPTLTSPHVTAKVLYLGATNEGGYEMFNINKIVAEMAQPWTIEYIPNYRHDSDSTIQAMDWQMWVSHIFDGRPLATISDLVYEEDAEGTWFRAKVSSPNRMIQTQVWFAYTDDEYWRDIMWYPEQMQLKGDVYQAFVEGKLPDAWLVEVHDIGAGFQGYVSSLPQDITKKPTRRRSGGGMPRLWSLKQQRQQP